MKNSILLLVLVLLLAWTLPACGAAPAETVATEPETTAPVTEPATEPTEAETEPVTEPSTEPEEPKETLPAEEEPEETQPVDVEFLAGKSWIGIVIVAAVLTLLLIGALVVRSAGRGGRYSR